jgi:hypothetical protein
MIDNFAALAGAPDGDFARSSKAASIRTQELLDRFWEKANQ